MLFDNLLSCSADDQHISSKLTLGVIQRIDCISIVINDPSIRASLAAISVFCFDGDIDNGISVLRHNLPGENTVNLNVKVYK